MKVSVRNTSGDFIKVNYKYNHIKQVKFIPSNFWLKTLAKLLLICLIIFLSLPLISFVV